MMLVIPPSSSSLILLLLLPSSSTPLSERSYCHAVCVSAALVSAAKVMRCIQCSLVTVVVVVDDDESTKLMFAHS